MCCILLQHKEGLTMLGFKKDREVAEFKIKESEFNKIKEEFKALKAENDNLRQRCNFEHLLRDINTLTEQNKALKAELQEVRKQKESTQRTLESERHTASLLLNKLREVTDTCERVIVKDKMTTSVYVKAVDLYV